jgi:hypothetical protein
MGTERRHRDTAGRAVRGGDDASQVNAADEHTARPVYSFRLG